MCILSHIVSYRGTIYGVYDSREKAEKYIIESWDKYWPDGSDWQVTRYAVE